MAETGVSRKPHPKHTETGVWAGVGEGRFEIAARWITWCLIAGTPLALATGIFLSHDVMPKVILVLCGAALLLFLSSRWIGGVSILWNERRSRWFLILVAAQAAVLTLSTLFSARPLLSIAGTTWRRLGLVEQVAILVIATATTSFAALKPESLVQLWRAASLTAAIASIYGIAQYFGFDPFLERRLYALDYLGGVVRPPATMGHAIYFASYLAPVAVVAGWQAVRDVSKWWRIMHWLAFGLACAAILLSGSRGALLGLLCGEATLLFFRRPSRRIIGAGAGAVVLAGMFVAFAPAGANLRHRIQQWKEDPGSVRIGVWKETPALIAKSPGLGSGPETFASALRNIESAQLARAYPDFINESPHNVLIDAACEEGTAGFLILAAVFAIGLSAKGLPGLRAAVTSIFICGIFASFSIVSAMYFWTICGIISVSHAARSPEPRTRSFAAVTSPAALLFISAAVLLGIQDKSYASFGRDVDANRIADAKQAFETATSFGFGLPGYELWASQQLARLKDWQDAAQAAALVQKRGEDPAGAAYQAAILAIVQQNASEAQAKAAEAIALAPDWYKPHLLRAQILQALGKDEESAREVQQSLALGWKGK